MILKSKTIATLILAALLSSTALPVQALQINASVANLGGGVFHYDFSIDNNDPLADLFQVTITDAPLFDALIGSSLSAPAAFLASYDSGLGLLDFLADSTPLFPFGVTGVFGFDSEFGPTTNFNSFEAFTLTDFPIPTVSGEVNIVQAQVPEPGGLALLGLGFLLSVSKLTAGRKLACNNYLQEKTL